MNNFRRRTALYALLGLVFGVIDWFYLDWLANAWSGATIAPALGIPLVLVMNYGVWLVPIVPVVLYESRRSEQMLAPMLAGALTWSMAMVSYYSYYAILLSLGRLMHLDHLNVIGPKPEEFWPEYWRMFNRIILSQYLEWTAIAVVGGAVTGAAVFWLSRRVSATRASVVEG
jgi:hypothetical protein